MIAHVVLFQPRSDLPVDERRALATAFEAALREVPTVRRARVGKRVVLGRPYDVFALAHYSYAVILEFDDHAGLSAYLNHPAHDELAARFYNALEGAFIYDIELDDAAVALPSLLTE